MIASKGWTIVRYDKGEDFNPVGDSGFLVASQRTQRMMVKGMTHNISGDPDHALPDVIRIGTVVASQFVEEGTPVLFNKHDGWGFMHNGDYLFALKDESIIASLAI